MRWLFPINIKRLHSWPLRRQMVADSSSALGQLSGLASLAGVSIGESNSESQIAQEIMKSWSFIDDFIVDNDIAVEVYAAEGWSERSGDLEIDGSLYDSAEGAWLIQDASTDELRAPTSWELFERFSEMLSVSQDKASGLCQCPWNITRLI